MTKDTEDKAGHTANNEQPNGKCSEGFGVASWTLVEMDRWLRLHVEVRVAVDMENQIVDVGRSAITTKPRTRRSTRRTRKLVNEREEIRKRTEWKEQKTINNEPKLN